ncbi:unnamed protein product [Ranitomeya imitator]|uniref:TAF1C beta-propeller domain-containing protein n=1 Tax=Ranitomeya imitator TaxID=111125 RepID=A0ABN9LCH8_9NEOB|nr:unnamed protein product [Ranitomeya imitator]
MGTCESSSETFSLWRGIGPAAINTPVAKRWTFSCVSAAIVGARAAFHLASWSFSAQDPPNPLCALKTTTPSTCINASPHIPAEFCVCTDSGTLYLWSVESGLQRVRQDPDSMFFRDDPHWRWSDFTSHPRVLTFADRTGVQIADIRVPNSQGAALFRIGQESSCQRGERVILPRCLREINPACCLVGTQVPTYSLYTQCPAWYSSLYTQRPAWCSSLYTQRPAWCSSLYPQRPAWCSSLYTQRPAWCSSLYTQRPAWYSSLYTRRPAWYSSLYTQRPACVGDN